MNELVPFLRLFWPSRLWIFWGLFFSLAATMASIGLLALSGWFLSAAAFAGMSAATAHTFNFFTPSAGVRGFAIVRTGGRYAERVLAHEATFRLLASLRVWFFDRIEPLTPARLARSRSGDLLGRIVGDIDTLDNLFIRLLSPSIVALGVGSFVGLFLWWLAPPLAVAFWLFYVAAGVLVPFIASRFGSRAGTETLVASNQLRTALVEDIQGMADLLAYGAYRKHQKRIAAYAAQLLQGQRKFAYASAFGSAANTCLAGFAVVILLIIAIPLSQAGVFDGAHIALIAFGSLAAFEAVMGLPLAWQSLGKTVNAATRLNEIVCATPAVTFPEQSIALPNRYDVVFQNVTFGYDPSKPIVQDFSLRIDQGKTVAIAGRSGIGKSTLAALLARLYDPQQGEIAIDGIDVRHFDEATLRTLIGVVSQKSDLFGATIRDNLLLGKLDANDDELWQALERAKLAAFVRTLPHGLETWVGESGATLSGGQGRRLVLARTLLKRPPIIILDEPTEGLDPLTRAEFMQTVWENIDGQTVLLITHDQDDLLRADAVVKMA